MNYKKTYKNSQGYTPLCKKGSCSLAMLEFGMIELKPETALEYDTTENETAFIILGGNADFAFDTIKWENVGGR